ncbi:hypothetical protein HN51_019542 [Arachis hypogaea]|uniref:C2H2-type domain-containing protein n=2 Tax=Arachis TaxID=3817 RepID=A0A445BX96_ARAHY|nr:uncharacterized protein LOC107462159 [Arachis duranensis]XP_025614481.1 uncharacterized protein LOC112707113 [Arachis hypogaea]QHO31324.1 uncharacterized protein DS421_8g240600 [Arachis hypogaea]RYR43355.1 hypothetical protein Ahy_A08g039780 [Arachis hypogaea]
MRGKKKGLSKATVAELKEQLAKKILRNVRAQGHPYVELRKLGKKNNIFFCILCLKTCFTDDVLYQHLRGNLHTLRLSTAKITLLKPNPWPFNDGLVFFHNSSETDKDLETTDASRIKLLKLTDIDSDKDLSLVKIDEPIQSDVQPSSADDTLDDGHTLVIRKLQIGDENVDIKVRNIGWGKIAARFLEKDHRVSGVRRIWCEWLGQEKNVEQDYGKVTKHDFALVIFSYNGDLGRIFEEDKSSLPSASMSESESERDGGRKRKKISSSASVSDSESEGDGGRKRKKRSHDSSTETSKDSTTRLPIDQNDKQLLAQIISSKAARKELRRRKRIAAEKLCNVCHQKMFPGKDVAALLNLETGKLACSTRNKIGLFHVFHASCIIHWILMCESIIIKNRLVLPTRRVAKKKAVVSDNQTVKRDDPEKRIKCVFCPECQGTGMATTDVDEHSLERTPFTLDEKFKFQMLTVHGRLNWIKNPEVVQNCSIGLDFPPSEEVFQEKVESIKLLPFYRADLECGDGAQSGA